MILTKFRIKNYKSIVDSGDCYFSEKLTILAGKNESGKTSVLEALEDFHQDRTIRGEAKPIESEEIPEVSISFTLSDVEVNEILTGLKLDAIVAKDALITLSKTFGATTYSMSSDSRKRVGSPNILDHCRKLIAEANRKADSLIKAAGGDAKFPHFDNKQRLSDYKVTVTTFTGQNPGLTEVAVEVENIGKAADEFYAREAVTAAFVAKFVEVHVPYFILFSSFDDKFPRAIPIAELAGNDWAQDLQLVSNFSIKKISSNNKQEQTRHENSVNIDFTEKFKQFWTQDDITLHVNSDTKDLHFWISERGFFYYPSQRSKGQQWYLSFYVKIVARLQEDKPNVILIDEPGLYLHAKAQKDLLQILIEYTKDNPVMFSTHSPYLITAYNLENVRLIEKGTGGTTILGKIHAHPTADKETLTPILTAIGLGINDSITNVDQKDNVVVEGPEDVFYLCAFKELEKKNLKTNFINGGGASNMGLVGAILEGWGANVRYLFDNDQGKKDGEKRLQEWKVLPEVIKVVMKKAGATIVDLLSTDDFKKYILESETLTYTSSNSEYVKGLKPRADKVLLARKFLQKAKAGEISLDEVSAENIRSLFKELAVD